VIPLSLFRKRVFAVASGVGFIVGFALFGVITYLPQYQQVVRGASATASGLQLFPLMGGLLIASIGSGQIISRTGRYKAFPVAGTALLAVGMFLLSHLGVHTSVLKSGLFMGVTGFGLGLTMQVLVLAVQNSVSPRDLGTATSAATFFRSIGGSIGVSVFSAIFNNKMVGNLAHQLPQLAANPKLASELRASPEALAKLPAPIHDGYLRAFTESLHVVFIAAIPVAIVAFALTWLLEEVPLRTTVAPVDGVGAAFGLLRAAAVQVRQEGQARVAAAKAALARLPDLGLPADQTAPLAEIFSARISRLEQIAGDTPEPEQVAANDWELAVDVLRTERQLLTEGEQPGLTARQEIEIRLAAAKAALARLEAGAAGADRSAVAPLRDAYIARIARLEGIEAGAAARDDLTPAFWQAAAALMAFERETLANWSADNLVDASVADLAERDLDAEAAELAVATP
jgi:MFS family permease